MFSQSQSKNLTWSDTLAESREHLLEYIIIDDPGPGHKALVGAGHGDAAILINHQQLHVIRLRKTLNIVLL